MKKIALVTLVTVVLSFTTTSAAFAWGWWNNVSVYADEEYTNNTSNECTATNVSVYNTDEEEYTNNINNERTDNISVYNTDEE